MRTFLKESEMAEYLEVILLRARRVLDPKGEITPSNLTRNSSKDDKNAKMQPTEMYEEILKVIQDINVTLSEEKRKSKNLGKENRKLQVSCVDLQTNIESIHDQTSHGNSKLEESCRKLSQDLEETHNLIDTLIDERKMMENTIDKCRKNKQSYVRKLQKMASEKCKLETQVNDVMSENETLKDFYNMTRRRNQKEVGELQQQCAELKEELNGLRVERNALKQEIVKLNEGEKRKDDNLNLNQVIDKLKDNLEKKKLECDLYKRDLAHVHQLYSTIWKKNQHRDVELIDANDAPKHENLSIETKCSWLYEELQNLRKTRDFFSKKAEKNKQMVEGWVESYNNLEQAYNQLYEEYCVGQHKLKEIQKHVKDKEDDLKLTRKKLEDQQQEVISLHSQKNEHLQPKDNLSKKCQSLEREMLILKDINGRYLSEIQGMKQEKNLLQREITDARQKHSIETEETKGEIKKLEDALRQNEDRFKKMQFAFEELKKSHAHLKLKQENEEAHHRSGKLELAKDKRFFDQISSVYSSLESLKVQSERDDSQNRANYSKAARDLQTAIIKQVNKLNDPKIAKQNEEFRKVTQRMQQELRHLERDSNTPTKDNDIRTHFEEALSKILRDVQGKLAKALVENDSPDSRSRQIEAKQKEIIDMFTQEYSRVMSLGTTEAEDPYVMESLQKIAEIRRKIEELEPKAENYRGTKEHTTYLNLEHKLMDCIMKTDVIQAMGHEVIRRKKNETYQYANDCLIKLDVNVAD